MEKLYTELEGADEEGRKKILEKFHDDFDDF